jgi:MFS family permease
MRPVLVAEYLGKKDFGLMAGILAAIYFVGYALGPTVGSFIWEIGGYDRVIEFAITMAIVACMALVLLRRLARNRKMPN